MDPFSAATGAFSVVSLAIQFADGINQLWVLARHRWEANNLTPMQLQTPSFDHGRTKRGWIHHKWLEFLYSTTWWDPRKWEYTWTLSSNQTCCGKMWGAARWFASDCGFSSPRFCSYQQHHETQMDSYWGSKKERQDNQIPGKAPRCEDWPCPSSDPCSGVSSMDGGCRAG